MPAIAKLTVFAFDCPDPRGLAEFYMGITGWELDHVGDEGRWVELRSDAGATLAFQLAPDHQPPVWPSSDHPQQGHLDFEVDELDAGESAVIALGAARPTCNQSPTSSGCSSIRRVIRSAWCSPTDLGVQSGQQTDVRQRQPDQSIVPAGHLPAYPIADDLLRRVPAEIEGFLRRLAVS